MGGLGDRQNGRRGTKRKMLFSRRRKSDIVGVQVTDKCRVQREGGCYSVGQKNSRHMNSLRGSEQPKKSESLN